MVDRTLQKSIPNLRNSAYPSPLIYSEFFQYLFQRRNEQLQYISSMSLRVYDISLFDLENYSEPYVRNMTAGMLEGGRNGGGILQAHVVFFYIYK